ncbi:MAG: sugar-binding protein [Acidobacteriota bacterium]|nr:sugar-binding protein [Acidobacteriota bacterium]
MKQILGTGIFVVGMLWLSYGWLTTSQTNQTQPLNYVCQRAVSAVNIDGKLDDAAWRNAKWTEVFVDIEGDAKPKPKYKTRAKMLWDDTYF